MHTTPPPLQPTPVPLHPTLTPPPPSRTWLHPYVTLCALQLSLYRDIVLLFDMLMEHGVAGAHICEQESHFQSTEGYQVTSPLFKAASTRPAPSLTQLAAAK